MVQGVSGIFLPIHVPVYVSLQTWRVQTLPAHIRPQLCKQTLQVGQIILPHVEPVHTTSVIIFQIRYIFVTRLSLVSYDRTWHHVLSYQLVDLQICVDVIVVNDDCLLVFYVHSSEQPALYSVPVISFVLVHFELDVVNFDVGIRTSDHVLIKCVRAYLYRNYFNLVFKWRHTKVKLFIDIYTYEDITFDY